MSLKQSAKLISNGTNEGRIPKSWEQGSAHPCVRIETNTGETFLLPYQQFTCARYQRHAEPDTDLLVLSFLSHEIQVKGINLAPLVDALQDFTMERLTPSPERYRHALAKTEPAIFGIEIRPIEKPL
jgi:hypothetical protein